MSGKPKGIVKLRRNLTLLEIEEFKVARKACSACGRNCTHWLRHPIYGWCDSCRALLVVDPEEHRANLPVCEYGPCTNDGEFISTRFNPEQIACRTHIGALSDGPWCVYGLSERAITAVKKWRQEDCKLAEGAS